MVRTIEKEGGIVPELISWDNVKALFIYDNLTAEDKPVLFSLAAITQEDSQLVIASTTVASDLRRMARALSKEHRCIVDDLTVPIFKGQDANALFFSEFKDAFYSDVAAQRGGFSDCCFLSGMDTDAFNDALKTASLYAQKQSVTLKASFNEIADTIKSLEVEQALRFRALCAANPDDYPDAKQRDIATIPKDGEFIERAKIPWNEVKELFIKDEINNTGAVIFTACCRLKNGFYLKLSKETDIHSVRALCAKLSAIHDKPSKDWTRPAPDIFLKSDMIYHLRNHLPLEKRGDIPRKENEWAQGWLQADQLFSEGYSEEEFWEELNQIEDVSRNLDYPCQIEQDKDEERRMIEYALARNRLDAAHRWRILHEANEKPEPSEDAFV